jgi:hypothetical protein
MPSSSLSAGSSTAPARAAQTIFLSGLVAGTLDITWAIVQTLIAGRSPMAMLRFIAGGLLGADALKGGVGTSMLGLGLHFVIAFGAAAVFYTLSRKISFLVQRPVLAGLLYGVVVWLVMNLVVLPLSSWHITLLPQKNWPAAVKSASIALAALVTCVGLPIALLTARFSRPAASRDFEA